MNSKNVSEVMEPGPEIIAPDQTLEQACRKMKDINCGILPVGSKEHLEGVITDRDIIVRAIADGVDPAIAIVKDYMTPGVHCCKESHTLKEAGEMMSSNNVSRLIVEDDAGAITGILSFGHALRSDAGKEDVSEMMFCAVRGAAA